jgi:sugar phosphate isomerase/epimerase
MRLGGPVFGDCSTPQKWIEAVQRAGYRAAYWPHGLGQPDDEAQAYADAARAADIVIAEVGAWSNPIDADESKRRAALEKCKASLALADRVGALCCVNITGSRGAQWDGPHPLNLSPETFDMIVECTRDIIDAVRPTRTFYTLETMPWMYPDSAQSYARLIQAIDRPQCAVHLDPVNLICSPQRFFGNAALLRECFATLGPLIKGCHAKDIALDARLTVHLDEVRPGLGGLDYRVFLSEMHKLHPDTPLMLEHLPTPDDYAQAAAHVRGVAREMEIEL